MSGAPHSNRLSTSAVDMNSVIDAIISRENFTPFGDKRLDPKANRNNIGATVGVVEIQNDSFMGPSALTLVIIPD